MADDTESNERMNALAPIIDATNLPSTLRGKAQRVFLRFLAGSLAHPYVREVRQNLDDMDARSRINMLVAEELGRQAIADPAFMERAKARLFGETVQKQENLESILLAANEKIEQSTDAGVEGISDTEPSQDWINGFTREAELASSDELRQRLATLLAGELQRPGSISRATVRAVAEMDQELLQSFNGVLDKRLDDAIPTDEDWNSGEMFRIGTMLEDAALISGIHGMTSKIIKFNETGIGLIISGQNALVFKGSPALEKRFPVWLLTKVGREIASLLPNQSFVPGLEKVASSIDKVGLESILLGRLVNNGQMVSHDQQLWPEHVVKVRPVGQGPEAAN